MPATADTSQRYMHTPDYIIPVSPGDILSEKEYRKELAR
jgi:hypothetical protein